jgi:hypothetical protein
MKQQYNADNSWIVWAFQKTTGTTQIIVLKKELAFLTANKPQANTTELMRAISLCSNR